MFAFLVIVTLKGAKNFKVSQNELNIIFSIDYIRVIFEYFIFQPVLARFQVQCQYPDYASKYYGFLSLRNLYSYKTGFYEVLDKFEAFR